MATEPRTVDDVRTKLVDELIPVIADIEGAPSLEDGARDIIEAIERVCTIIPLASGPVVVAAEAWGAFPAALDAMAIDVFGESCEGILQDEFEKWGPRILAALHPNGVLVAEAVGRLEILDPDDEAVVCLMPPVNLEKAGTAPILETGDPVALLRKETP